MTARHIALTLGATLLTTTAFAADNFYRSDPSTWVLNGATRGLAGSVIAPDGSAVTPIISAGPSVGNAGPCAYYANRSSCTMQVASNGTDNFSIFYKWISGNKGVSICINSDIVGAPKHQCLNINGKTGVIVSVDPYLKAYGLAPIGGDGWFRAWIQFTTVKAGVAFPYLQFDASTGPQNAALWRAQLATGKSTQ